MEELLEELNLSPVEIKIYKLLISNGPQKAGDIARKIGSHRRNTYDAIERLISKALVSYIKENNLKYFQANDPNIILDRLQEKEQRLKTLIPKIQENMLNWQEKKETLFFRGASGIKQVLLEMIKEKDEILIQATSNNVMEVVKYFFPKYERLREEENIPTRMIFDSETATETKKHVKSLKNCKLKFIDNFNSTKTSKHIFGNNVATILWDEEPFVILIREKEIAKAAREEFELFWNIKI